MWRGDHTARAGVWRAGIVTLVAIACGMAAFAARAQEAEQAQQADQPAVTTPLVDWSHAKQAHRLVEKWVHAGHWGQPKKANASENDHANNPDTPESRPTIRVRGVMGVKVTLRNQGQFAGAGAAYRQNLNPLIKGPGQPTNLAKLLSRATKKALKQAHQAVLDARLKSLRQGIKKTVERPTLEQVGSRLQVGLQIGKTLTPINVNKNDSLAKVFARFAPGYHGLRLIAGQGNNTRWACKWPADAVSRNAGPKSQLVQLLDDVGLEFTDLKTIARPDGPRLQRYQVIHMVRPRLDMPVQRLRRSQTILPPNAVSEATLNGIGRRLGDHLYGRFNADGLLRGTFRPAKSTYDPTLAEPVDQALGYYALTRQAARIMAAGRKGRLIKQQARRALKSATRLGQSQLQADRFDPATASLLVLTLIDTPLGNADQQVRDKLVKRLKQRHIKNGRFKSLKNNEQNNPNANNDKKNQPPENKSDKPKEVSQPTGALIAAALTAMYDQTRNDALQSLAADARHRSWQRLNQNTQLAAMPWVGLAHQRSVKLAQKNDGKLPQRIRTRQKGLAKLIDQLAEKQIIDRPKLGPSDVIGGFQLRNQPSGAPPSPDWHSAQVLMLLATTMRDQKLLEKSQRFGWILTAGLGARFIGQLMMDEPGCYFVTSRSDAIGGVRMALWDNRLPVSATAISLLAVNELQAVTSDDD